jgi:hypothetical protein
VRLPLRLLVATLRVDLRVAAADRVLLVLRRFGFPRLLADFLVVLAAADRLPVAERFVLTRLVVDFSVALRFVAAADPLPPAERLALPCLVAAPLDVVFFLVERRFPR